MYRFFGLMACLMCLATACYQNPAGTDVARIPMDKMALVLCDMHVAEGAAAEIRDPDTKDTVATGYYGQILSAHQLSKADFDQSMRAYMDDPKLLQTLYEQVIAVCQAQEAEATKAANE